MDVKNKLNNVSTSLVTNIKNPKSKTFITVISIVSILTLLFIINSIIKYKKFKKNNPSFFKDGKDTKKQEVIKADKLNRPDDDVSFTLFTWLYVDNMSYMYGNYKHILSKGFMGQKLGVCPSMYIHSTQNDIVIWISTKNGGVEEMILYDFPIRKWFSIALIIRSSSVDVLLNGRLNISKPLPNPPKINNGPMYINAQGGFQGQLAGLRYFTTPLAIVEISKINSTGPYGDSLVDKIYNYLTGMTKKLQNSVKKSFKSVAKGDDKKTDVINTRNLKLHRRSAPHNFWEWANFRWGKSGNQLCNNRTKKQKAPKECDFTTFGIELMSAITCSKENVEKGYCKYGLTLKQAINKYGETGFIYIPIKKGHKKDKLYNQFNPENLLSMCKAVDATTDGKYKGECNIIIPVKNTGSKESIRKYSRRTLSTNGTDSIETSIGKIFDVISNFSWGYYDKK